MRKLMVAFSPNPHQVIQVCQGDITLEDTDAIVNPANNHLRHGGGVAGAIVRRGGDVIQEASNSWIKQHGSLPTGQVTVTGSGRLPCRYIIHAVGPVWQGGQQNEPDLLRQATWNSLLAAHDLGLSSIAIPAISSGIFGFPKNLCARILIQACIDFCSRFPGSPLREIRLTNIDTATVDIFSLELEKRLLNREA